jgi:hypothetical protein
MKKLISALLFSLVAITSQAETDTIRIADNRLLKEALKPCSRQYLVYRQHPKTGTKKQISVWERNVAVQQNKLVITQKWFGADTITRQLYSVCDLKSFRPVYHYARNLRNETEAYNFAGNVVSGADSVKNNLKKDFKNEWKAPVFNWELDMETLSALPFKKDKKFVIPFYHPGSTSGPAYYVYEVIGEEKMRLGNEKPQDCWKLKISYSEKNYAVFWIAKKEKEVLKMEELFNGWYRYKIKLATLPAKASGV